MGDQSRTKSKLVVDETAEKQRLAREIARVEKEMERLKQEKAAAKAEKAPVAPSTKPKTHSIASSLSATAPTASAIVEKPKRNSKLADKWLQTAASKDESTANESPKNNIKESPIEAWRRQASSRKLNLSSAEPVAEVPPTNKNNDKKKENPIEVWRKQASSRRLQATVPMEESSEQVRPSLDRRTPSQRGTMQKTNSVRDLVQKTEQKVAQTRPGLDRRMSSQRGALRKTNSVRDLVQKTEQKQARSSALLKTKEVKSSRLAESWMQTAEQQSKQVHASCNQSKNNPLEAWRRQASTRNLMA
eukprot:CAMPEP_0172471614 /NCGR_PEP_ID=MMETSP1065-20121228/67909_1 /TAXON_ID=265537 /ORGANISM="Amphiprora paludosa, Strain CCMP125" /LENGTH=302 /DNA_ID=CAMNT_0013229717 /DNA_START=37 /DNA_END=945 /DNA_ORIENTATION=-